MLGFIGKAFGAIAKFVASPVARIVGTVLAPLPMGVLQSGLSLVEDLFSSSPEPSEEERRRAKETQVQELRTSANTEVEVTIFDLRRERIDDVRL